MKSVAIILAAGRGKRMKSDTAKQYLLLKNKPILSYAIKAFDESNVDEIIIVVGKNEIEYCKENILKDTSLRTKYSIIEGGKERYDSVYCGLQKIDDAEYVLIHDGARPFISAALINKMIAELNVNKACIAGVPSKDTMKIVDKNQIVVATPDRDMLWSIQTPQCFSYNIIREAYNMLMHQLYVQPWEETEGNEKNGFSSITDDAMIVETFLHYPVTVVQGSYNNIKITTSEDLVIGEKFLEDWESDY